MTTVQSTSQASTAAQKKAYKLNAIEQKFYEWGTSLFNLPEKADGFVARHTVTAEAGSKLGLGAKAKNTLVNWTGSLAKTMSSWDFNDFRVANIGPLSAKLAEIAPAQLMVWMYAFTIVPRAFRAYQRGKERNDFREVGDCLRRDIPGITIFLFGLKPIVRNMTKLQERLSGVKLVADNEVLKYSQLAQNYYIDNANSLIAIMRDGNEQGMKKAVDRIYDAGLSKGIQRNWFARALDSLTGKAPAVVQDSRIATLIDQEFKPSMESFMKAYAEAKGRVGIHAVHEDGAVRQAAEKAVGILSKMEGIRSDLAKNARPEVQNLLKSVPKFKEFFARHAKMQRVPIDVISFAAVSVAIGWLPVAFNDWWNRAQFQRKLDALPPEPSPVFTDAASAFQFLKTSEPLKKFRFDPND
jgi:hypothetical protein